MGNDGQPEVKVGYLQLSEQEKKLADAVLAETKSFLVSGFKDELARARAEWEKEIDPSTRPGFSSAPLRGDTMEADIKRYGALRRPIVHKHTGQTVGYADTGSLLTKKLSDDHALGAAEGGLLPPMQLSPDARDAAAREFAEIIKSDKGFEVLRFPRGDLENFSVCRWAMALERSQNTAEGTSAFQKWAPYESAYYSALERYNATKAQGDMVSGQDGGFLAPEL